MVHIILLLSFFTTFLSRKNKKLFIIPFLLLIIFAAFRYNYGNDYIDYFNCFNYIHNGIKIFQDEILYYYLNKFFLNFQFMIACISTIYLYLVYLIIKKNVSEKYYYLAIFIFLINPYLFLMSLSAIRQTLATCFFIVSLYFSYKRKILPYIILIVTAALIHKSAIILLPIYFVANDKKIKNKNLLFVIFIILIFVFIPKYFYDLLNYVLSFFNDKNFNFYVSEGMNNSIRSVILSSIIFVYVVLNIKKLSGKELMYSKLYLISLILNILSINISMITRVQMYFDIFAIITIPAIFNINNNSNIKEKRFLLFLNKYFLPFLVIIIFCLRYYSFFTNPLWKEFFTYISIFSGGN